MAKKIIHNQKISLDSWQILAKDAFLSAENQVIYAQNFAAQLKKEKNNLTKPFGILLDSLEVFDQIKPLLNNKANHPNLIICLFAHFKNGFFYSIANILRQQLDFQGDLRASGEVYADQLTYLINVGFNSFELKNEAELELGLKMIAQATNNLHYQIYPQ